MQHNLPHGRREIAQGLSSRASLSHGARPRGLFMTLAALLRSLLAKATKGDVRAGELLLDRTFGKLRTDVDVTSAGQAITPPIIWSDGK